MSYAEEIFQKWSRMGTKPQGNVAVLTKEEKDDLDTETDAGGDAAPGDQ